MGYLKPFALLGIALCLSGPAIGADVFERAGKRHGVDANLLRSIAKQESQGHPWTLNFGGHSLYLPDRETMLRVFKASRNNPWLVTLSYKDGRPVRRVFFPSSKNGAAFRDHMKKQADVRNARMTKLDILNVDIGLMQINWRWHKDKFPSVEAMGDVEGNVNYAARYLAELIREYGIIRGVGYYHHRKSTKRWKDYYRRIYHHYGTLTNG